MRHDRIVKTSHTRLRARCDAARLDFGGDFETIPILAYVHEGIQAIFFFRRLKQNYFDESLTQHESLQ